MKAISSSKRDRYYLFILLLPLLCGITIDLVINFTRNWSATLVDLEILLKEISWFAIGLTLLVRPDVILRALSERLLTKIENKNGFVACLRVLGLMLVVVLLFSFPFLIERLFEDVHI